MGPHFPVSGPHRLGGPTGPGAPCTPGVPGGPGGPIRPSGPGPPRSPRSPRGEGPRAPGGPAIPRGPRAPGVPGTPRGPRAPGGPSTPRSPGGPRTPCGPGGPGTGQQGKGASPPVPRPAAGREPAGAPLELAPSVVEKADGVCAPTSNDENNSGLAARASTVASERRFFGGTGRLNECKGARMLSDTVELTIE